MATAPAQSLAYLLDPSLYGNAIDIGNQQAIAQALLQSGLTPMGGTEMAGNVAIRRSPTEGLAKIAQLLSGVDIQSQLIPRQMQQMYGQAGANAAAVGGIGGPGQGLVPRLPGDQTGMMSSLMLGSDPSKYAELTAAANQPTDIQKLLAGRGIYPGMPGYAEAFASALNKANSQSVGRGGIVNPDGTVTAPAPAAQEGFSVHFNPQTGQWEQVQMVNGPQAVQAAAAAQAAGKASVNPTVTYGLDGKPQYSTQLLDAQRGGYGGLNVPGMPPSQSAPQGPPNVPGTQGYDPTKPIRFQTTDPTALRASIAASNAPEKATLLAAFDKQFGNVMAFDDRRPVDPTQQLGRQQQQEYVGKSWTAVTAAASQAQPIINNLQQIQNYAQTAQTGQQADRFRLADSVLALLGSQSATDRQIAGDLLGKNSSQIVARLGSGGGMDTDAARGLLMSAFPNAHMMSAAIMEASTNLIAQQKMVQAKQQVLQPIYAKNDPTAYVNQEAAFSLNADPRLFQWSAMPPGKAKFDYQMTILKQDPSLGMKAKQLEALGVQL